MSRRFFDDEEKYGMDIEDDMEMDESPDPGHEKKKGGVSKLIMGACVIALIGAVAGVASLGMSAVNDASAKKEMQKAVDEYIGYREFENFILFVVLYCEEEKWNQDKPKLQYILRRAMPMHVRQHK